MVYHSRLKIIDLHDRSSQPMKRDNFSIIYNGEIYNYIELRKELQKFYNFTTNSDTEVLLFSFLKWGKDIFKKIEGMYSFVIYDEKRKYFFAARDYFGQKPLYYFKKKSEIFFSSEIKPIIKFFNLKISFEKRIYKYLNHNFFGDTKYTFFKNIYQIPPGSYCEFKKNKLIFNKINIGKVLDISEKSIKKSLIYSVKKSLVSDKEVALLYSGGTDSQSLYDILPSSKQKKIKLFNLKFENFAEKTKIKNKTNLRSFILKKKNFFNNLNQASKICESPPLSLFTLGYLKLFDSIKKNKIKVILNGQGIDENFGGYKYLFKKITKNKVFHPSGEILLNDNKYFKKKVIFKQKRNIIQKKIELLKKNKIPKNLCQIDKLSMYNSLECRSPFLTNLFFKNTIKLKIKQMKKNNTYKYIFRKLLFSITKDQYYFLEKNFKQSPQEEYMRDIKILNKINKIINKKNSCDKFFNKKKLLHFFYEFKNNGNTGFLIWQYISLNSFMNNFKKINFF